MKLIELRKQWKPSGLFVTVDDDDFIFLSHYKWHLRTNKAGNKYAMTGSLGKRQSMHRMVLKSPLEIDHIDGNSLNNCKSNLRPVTRFQNSGNRLGRKNKITKGVSKIKQTGRYRAYINIDNQQEHLGVFATSAEAQAAYDVAAKRIWGVYATTATDLQLRARI